LTTTYSYIHESIYFRSVLQVDPFEVKGKYEVAVD
jgi:hypothetical protein